MRVPHTANISNSLGTKLRWLLVISALAAFLATGTSTFAASLRQTLPHPITQYVLLQETITLENTIYQIQRIDFHDEHIVIVGYVINSGSTKCFSRTDFKLQVGNVSYDAIARSTWIENAYGVNSPGTGWYTQCISRNATDLMVLPFKMTVGEGATSLWYANESKPFSRSLADMRGTTVDALPTPTPTPTTTRTPTSTPTNTPTPTVTFTPAAALYPADAADSVAAVTVFPASPDARRVDVSGIVTNHSLEFQLLHIDFWDVLPDGSVPRNAYYAVLLGTLHRIEDGTSSSGCVGASNVDLYIGDTRVPMAEKLRAANRHYDVTFPGFVFDLCVSRNRSDSVLYVFDVPDSADTAALSFHNAHLTLPASLAALKQSSRGAPVLLPTATATPEATATTESAAVNEPATATPEPTPTETAVPLPDGFIVDFRSLLGFPLSHVETILGEGRNETAMEAGLLWTYDSSTVAKDYDYASYTFTAFYDLDDILRGLQIIDGLSENGYVLDDWPVILAVTGFPHDSSPDSVAPVALRWDNLDGYLVWIGVRGANPDGNVWTMQAWIDEDAPLRTPEPTATPALAHTPTTEPTPTHTATVAPTATPTPALPTANTSANLRAGPGTNYEAIGSVPLGQTLDIIGRNAAGDWYALAGGAWIAAFLVDNAPAGLGLVDAPPPPTATPIPPTPVPAPPVEPTAVPQQPSQPEPQPPAPPVGQCQPGQVDINSASFEELQRIIHIGPDRAGQIQRLRPFSSVDSMTRINGIAAARLVDIKRQGVACVN